MEQHRSDQIYMILHFATSTS